MTEAEGAQTHLETERLLLRRFTPADADLLVALDGDPEVMRYLSGGSPTPREEIERTALPRFLRSNERTDDLGYWAVIEQASGAFLGRIYLRPIADARPDELDLGYRLNRLAWGKGYATEASRALICKGFADPRVQRIVASAIASNIASRRVMEKVGLTLVRTSRVTWPDRFGGVEQIKVDYALERADWERQAAASQSEPALP
jgi:RimJ/RimL family protein N-acetyltransferase